MKINYSVFRTHGKFAEEFPTHMISAIYNSLVLRWFYDHMEVRKQPRDWMID